MKTHGRSVFALADYSIRGKQPVAGFTLVELLVVIAIIGMLMALLLPAVQQAKETARRAVCLNNEKQLVTAMQNYDTSKGQLPGYINSIAKGAANPTSDLHGRMATWVIMLFPYMERNDVWSQWSDASISSSILQAPYMELLVCPSNPPTTQDQPWLAYVVNCGRQDSPNVNVGTSPPNSSAAGGPEKLANGVFFNRFNDPALKDDPYYNSNPTKIKFMQLPMSLGKIPDGGSNTLMLSENTAAYKYTYSDNGALTRYVTNDAAHQYTRPIDAECATGMVWDPKPLTSATAPPSNPAQKINGTDKITTTPPFPEPKKFAFQIGDKLALGGQSAYYYARPSSYHPGGVNAAFCGGEILFLREDLDYKVYKQLMTSDGKHSDDVDNQLLQDSDYK